MAISPYYLEAAALNADNGAYIVNKFGHNASVGTSPVPICHGAIYRTPQVSGATKLRVKAGDANDTAAGSGARSIYIEGINEEGYKTSEILATNGTSAGANSVNNYIRLYRAYVQESGTYASQVTSSHAADIVIENSAGTEDWATIDYDAAGYGDAQTEIGAFTIPKGKDGYLLSVRYSVDTSKVTSLYFYKRENILQTAAPYSAVRKQFGISAAIRDGEFQFKSPLRFPELTDIGFLAHVDTGTAAVSVEFGILLRDKE